MAIHFAKIELEACHNIVSSIAYLDDLMNIVQEGYLKKPRYCIQQPYDLRFICYSPFICSPWYFDLPLPIIQSVESQMLKNYAQVGRLHVMSYIPEDQQEIFRVELGWVLEIDWIEHFDITQGDLMCL